MGTILTVASQVGGTSATYNTTKTTNASNTTAVVPIFRIAGSVRCAKLYGIVTTVLSSNHTGAYWRINDQTAQVSITTSIVGATLSAFAVGGMVIKTGLAAAVAGVKNANAGGVVEPTTLETLVQSEFLVTAKNGANTDIEYVYTTTNTPASGAIQFFLQAEGLSADAAVTPL